MYFFNDQELEAVSNALKKEKKKRKKIIKLESIPEEVQKHFTYETNGFGHITIMRWRDREHIPHTIKLMPVHRKFRHTVHGKSVDYPMNSRSLISLLNHSARCIDTNIRALAVKHLLRQI